MSERIADEIIDTSSGMEWGEVLEKAIRDVAASHDVNIKAHWVRISVVDRLFGNIHPGELIQYMEETRAANDNSVSSKKAA